MIQQFMEAKGIALPVVIGSLQIDTGYLLLTLQNLTSLSLTSKIC